MYKGILKFDKTTTIAINYSLGDWPSPLKSLRLWRYMSVNCDGIATFPINAHQPSLLVGACPPSTPFQQ